MPPREAEPVLPRIVSANSLVGLSKVLTVAVDMIGSASAAYLGHHRLEVS